MLEANLRYDNVVVDTNGAAKFKPWQPSSIQAITYGLKWSFYGKNYTSVNYTVYGVNGGFTALAGTELWTIQQQFNL